MTASVPATAPSGVSVTVAEAQLPASAVPAVMSVAPSASTIAMDRFRVIAVSSCCRP